MKERPILFSGPMVKAILEGRKTQTRRIVKPQPETIGDAYSRGYADDGRWLGDGCGQGRIKCPYGVPGDELWVREAWMETCDPDTLKPSGRAIYRATHEGREPIRCDGDGFQVWNKDNSAASPWRPSIHMPRWASRISLVVKSVRVERLQDITKTDCIAEGMEGLEEVYAGWYQSYAQLWESINGPGSWDENPWVWVIEFEVKK